MQITFWLPLWAVVAWQWAGAAFLILFAVTGLLALGKRCGARWVFASAVPLLAWLTYFVARGLAHWPPS